MAPRRGSSAVRAHLTPQEAAVAELAAAGRTNRQVAEALTVTQKTVEYHLSNVFLKLGISSRRHLAGHLGDAGTPR